MKMKGDCLVKTFIFNWHKNDKDAFERKSTITAGDSASAMSAFIAHNGNLKKNEVTSIQEIDNKGNPVGEPITLMEPDVNEIAQNVKNEIMKEITAKE